MINRWTYNKPVNIQEIRLGNRFHLPEVELCIVTDIDDNENIQLKNLYNGDIYVGETVKSIRPIFLTNGGNLLIENRWLCDQGFIYNQEDCQFENGDVIIKQGIGIDYWTISKGNNKTIVLFQHELQNAITDFTQNVLN